MVAAARQVGNNLGIAVVVAARQVATVGIL